MTVHRLLALTAAAGAIAAGAPAAAEPNTPGGVVFESVPVVQPVDAPAPIAQPVAEREEEVIIYETARETAGLPSPSETTPPAHPPYYGHGHAPHAVPAYHPSSPPVFDRDAWLADCRDRIRGMNRDDRARVIGGLLGAAAGGVIGNRAWDSQRLAGTLLGAGVGGIAGLAIGSAIAAAGDRRREDECAWHLDRYLAGPYTAPAAAWGGYPAYGYGHGYGYGYGYGYPAVTYVPVLVQVPQRAVVREYVTEEWVDEPLPTRTRSLPRSKIAPHAPPSAGKRTKLIKTR